jgi:hypothetical protein
LLSASLAATLVQNFCKKGVAIIPKYGHAAAQQLTKTLFGQPVMSTTAITQPVSPAAASEGARVLGFGLLLLVLVLIITSITGVAYAPAN